MRSLIILEVEHGEDTDAFTDVAEEVAGNVSHFLGGGSYAKVTDYTVRVDLPECFVLDSGNGPTQAGRTYGDLYS